MLMRFAPDSFVDASVDALIDAAVARTMGAIAANAIELNRRDRLTSSTELSKRVRDDGNFAASL
jgi:hypothetical protein